MKCKVNVWPRWILIARCCRMLPNLTFEMSELWNFVNKKANVCFFLFPVSWYFSIFLCFLFYEQRTALQWSWMEKAETLLSLSTAEKYFPASLSPRMTRWHEIFVAWWVIKHPRQNWLPQLWRKAWIVTIILPTFYKILRTTTRQPWWCCGPSKRHTSTEKNWVRDKQEIGSRTGRHHW